MFERIASRAANVPVAKLLLSILSIPFWILGAFVALLWCVIAWGYAALCVGFGDVRSRVKAQDDDAG